METTKLLCDEAVKKFGCDWILRSSSKNVYDTFLDFLCSKYDDYEECEKKAHEMLVHLKN